jgi:serine/threonine protein kinase
MSPEMIRGVKYTEKVDVYSFGVLLCEMYSHKIPFKSLHALQVAHRV